MFFLAATDAGFVSLAAAKTCLGSYQDLPWQLPRPALAAAKTCLGSCQDLPLPAKLTEPAFIAAKLAAQTRLGRCQDLPWQLPRPALAAAKTCLYLPS